ncbi:D-aminoacylase [Pseudothermotoga sp.]|uniref:N-acyl-D-amino-acid deacylase family protein n=1 Tax=Pseudothermotoga sp. TaxID=2033661 RepID=UPI0031F6DCBC
MFDVLLINGMVVDGTGSPWFHADIAVKNGKIVEIGNLRRKKARLVIDAKGMFVCPGFIDIHSHSDFSPFVNPFCESKVKQGVTTELVGNCGYSLAPLLGEALEEVKKYHKEMYGMEAGWQSVEEYLAALENTRPAINYAMLVGHGTIRKSVMGYENRKPTLAEMKHMKKLVDDSMKQGAFGLSTGLIYPPGSYASTEEIFELCKVVAKHNGFYATHMRNESSKLIESVEEAIEIGKKSAVAVQISHHKACGQKYFGKVKETLKLIEETRSKGYDITCDVYPYIATATDLDAILPDWVHEGGIEKMIERLKNGNTRKKIEQQIDPVQRDMGGYEKIYITYVSSEKNRVFQGKSLAEIARFLNKTPLEVAFDLIVEERAKVGMMRFAMDEEDVKLVIKSPYSMIGSDGSALSTSGILSKGHPHPRNFGTFPRVLAHYVRESKLLSVEEAVRKMTSFPASRIGLLDRGVLRPGMVADLVVFDLERVQDLADFEDPKRYPKGIVHVLVNGIPVVRDEQLTGERPGKVLRR